jgi:acyl carrier protein
MNTEDTIREIIAKVSGKPVTIGASESLFDSGVLDSFALVDVVNGLEQQFKVKIPDSDLSPRKFSSIARIQEYLEPAKYVLP